MLVLSYLWLLALIPFLVEKNDREVQWHAKNGLILLAAEIIAWVAYWIIVFIIRFVPFLGQVLGCLGVIVLSFGPLVLRIMAIMKAVKGERMLIPVVSDYVEKI